jgi:hypothetical protein
MKRFSMAAVLLLSTFACSCQKNPKLGTVAVDLYIHPESSSSEDLMLQTAIRRKLAADPLTAMHVQARVSGLEVTLFGNVAKKDAADRAEAIVRATRIVVDNDPPIVAGPVKNLIKVGNQ